MNELHFGDNLDVLRRMPADQHLQETLTAPEATGSAGEVATAAGEAYFPSLAVIPQEVWTMTTSFDFVAACKPGMAMRTRDHSEATIGRVVAEEGLIYGEVRVFGPCIWQQDGRFRDAPAGAAGPLDLMPPGAAAEAKPRKTISLKDALDPASRSFCCD